MELGDNALWYKCASSLFELFSLQKKRKRQHNLLQRKKKLRLLPTLLADSTSEVFRSKFKTNGFRWGIYADVIAIIPRYVS